MKEEKKQEEQKETQMNEETLKSILLELSNSKYWDAINIYLNFKAQMADNVLRTLDPFKQATEIARNQGFRSGLLDLSLFVDSIKEDIKQKNEPKKE